MIQLINSNLDTTSLVPTHRYHLKIGNEIVGTGGIRTKTTKAGDIVYFINPKFRRQGYGKKILELLLKECKKLGKQKVILVCKENNIASKKIIESSGGMFIGEQIRKNKENRLQYVIEIR
jgi:predicted acetyltransferase